MVRDTAERMIKHNLDKLDDNWIRFFWAVVVSFVPFQAYNGRIQGDRIGIRIDLSIEDINYVLAHELAHIHLHTGNLLGSDIEKECEIQADKAANMVLDVLQSV